MVPDSPHGASRANALQDLGTTYSCVGVMQKGKVEILTNDQGKLKLSSVMEMHSSRPAANGAPPRKPHHSLIRVLYRFGAPGW